MRLSSCEVDVERNLAGVDVQSTQREVVMVRRTRNTRRRYGRLGLRNTVGSVCVMRLRLLLGGLARLTTLPCLSWRSIQCAVAFLYFW
jgi:hypothetical protein